MGVPGKKASGRKKPNRPRPQVRRGMAAQRLMARGALCMHLDHHRRRRRCRRMHAPHPLHPSPALPPLQLTAEEHFENAQMAFAMDNLPQARSSFKRALDMEPEVREGAACWGRDSCCLTLCRARVAGRGTAGRILLCSATWMHRMSFCMLRAVLHGARCLPLPACRCLPARLLCLASAPPPPGWSDYVFTVNNR